MLSLSVVFKSKELWSVGYGSMECDDNDEWSFGGAEYKWSIWVTGIDRWVFGLAIDSPYKRTRIFTNR